MVGFSDRAVAFLDVLGFKRLIDDAETSPAGLNRLINLKTVLESHVRFDNQTIAENVPEMVHPKYIFISDSIIISAPLQHAGYDGLSIVAVKCIQVAQKLLESGFLLRGGISVGKAWHEASNIFGSGYIDALETEKVAKHPRIILSPAATAVWRTPGRQVPEIFLPEADTEVLDILNPFYLRTNNANIPYEDFFGQLNAYISQNLDLLPRNSDPWLKWAWMREFFNSGVRRHQINMKAFLFHLPHEF
jgi:hypothetical protein